MRVPRLADSGRLALSSQPRKTGMRGSGPVVRRFKAMKRSRTFTRIKRRVGRNLRWQVLLQTPQRRFSGRLSRRARLFNRGIVSERAARCPTSRTDQQDLAGIRAVFQQS